MTELCSFCGNEYRGTLVAHWESCVDACVSQRIHLAAALAEIELLKGRVEFLKRTLRCVADVIGDPYA